LALSSRFARVLFANVGFSGPSCQFCIHFG
jgi:hypothetical protein